MFVKTYIVNAFIDGAIGGNPAGVVLNADSLSTQQKQMIAVEIGLSETSFVSSSDTADFKLEFFTPERQIAHCGHATIATFALLRELGMISNGLRSKETIDGNRSISVNGNQIFMEQSAPHYAELSPHDYEASLKALGLESRNLIENISPALVSTGNRFLILPVENETVLSNLRPDLNAICAISAKLDLVGFYAFSLQTKMAGRVAGARMFAPRYGIDEEAATGMAAGPLACFLYDRMGIKQETILIEQGHLMQQPSPSVLTARLDIGDNGIDKLMVGGSGVVKEEKIIAVYGTKASQLRDALTLLPS